MNFKYIYIYRRKRTGLLTKFSSLRPHFLVHWPKIPPLRPLMRLHPKNCENLRGFVFLKYAINIKNKSLVLGTVSRIFNPKYFYPFLYCTDRCTNTVLCVLPPTFILLVAYRTVPTVIALSR
jgi:hypothetical protein